MSKKAVDVVLLPSDEIVYKVIKLNRQLVEKFGARIVLNKESCSAAHFPRDGLYRGRGHF